MDEDKKDDEMLFKRNNTKNPKEWDDKEPFENATVAQNVRKS